MKASRIVAAIAMMAVVPALTAFAEPRKPDVMTRFQAFMPQTSEDWETGGGIELQARFWSSESFGTALCLGFDSWTAKSEYSESSDEFGTTTTSIYGNVGMIPVGVSVLYRNNVSGRVAMVFEAGVRYVFTESNINAEIATSDSTGTSYQKDKIETDSIFIGLVGVGVETELMDGMSMQLGFGYQFDLTKPHETFGGEDMGTTSFNSPMVNIGLTWAF